MKTLQQRTLDAIDAGYTVGQLAKAAGVSSAAVSLWKSGATKKLKGDSAAGLEELTKWRASWWADGKGPRDLPDPAPNRPSRDYRQEAEAVAMKIKDGKKREAILNFLRYVDEHIAHAERISESIPDFL